MRFWDSSAVVALVYAEQRSRQAQELFHADPRIVVWWGSRVECSSALRRRERDGTLDADAVAQAMGLLDTLAGAWVEVMPTEAVRAQAERALALHPLRASDALQLGAAITWRREPAQRPRFVCLDERLRDAAAREGFTLLPPALEETG